MELLKRIFLQAFAFTVFIIFLMIFADEAKGLYKLLQDQQNEKTVRVVEGKTAFSDLFGRITYYAVLDEDAQLKATTNLPGRDITEISKKEFEQLKVGDKIAGNGNGSAFSDEDVRSEIFAYLIMMGVMLVYPIFYIFYQLIHIPVIEKWVDKHNKKIGRLLSVLFIGGICIGLLFSYISMGKMIVSIVQSHGSDQYETTALITDSDHDYNSGRYNSDSYYMALTFNDKNGEPVHLTKEVKHSDYFDHNLSIDISYPEGNPYKVHTTGFRFIDIFFYLGTELFIYGITIILTILLIYAGFLTWRKRKTGSYWPKKTGKKS